MDDLNEDDSDGSHRRQVWHALYDAHAESVWRYVAKWIGPKRSEVADVVQETFIASARAFSQFDKTRGSPIAWLTGIARRQVALHFRKLKSRSMSTELQQQRAETSEQLVEWLEGRTDSPPQVAHKKELAELVRSVLAELDESHASILAARYLDGLEIDAIAQTENCTTSAIRSRLARARKAFRQALLAMSPDHADIGEPLP